MQIRMCAHACPHRYRAAAARARARCAGCTVALDVDALALEEPPGEGAPSRAQCMTGLFAVSCMPGAFGDLPPSERHRLLFGSDQIAP